MNKHWQVIAYNDNGLVVFNNVIHDKTEDALKAWIAEREETTAAWVSVHYEPWTKSATPRLSPNL